MGYDHTTVDYETKKKRKEKVIQLMENGDWRAVIQEFGVSNEDEEISQRFQTCFMQGEDKYREPLLVWIRPTLPSLTFIKEQVNRLGLSGISSVGCGCGTLEWLIQVMASRC